MTGFARFLSLCSGDLFGRYFFSLKERCAGARFHLRGYGNDPQVLIEPLDDTCDRALIGEIELFLAKGLFKAEELALIHNEVFTPAERNPHAYETGDVIISPGDTVVDAGACEGLFIHHALARRAGKVLVFEPLAPLIHGLRRTFPGQIAAGKVEIIAKGLSDRSGAVRLSSREENLICSAHFDPDGEHEAEVVTLDACLAAKGWPRIDFVKMDVEGAEVSAIAGAIETLRRFRPKLTVAVYHEHENAVAIRKLLASHVPDYRVRFGGCWMAERPYRPFMLYASCPSM